MNSNLDVTDSAIAASLMQAREKHMEPRMGDYVLFPTGQLERFSNDLKDSLQTSPGGSFYLSLSGRGSFSGGLNPGTPRNALELTQATLPGSFWFFHHNIAGADRGVDFEAPCRVYKTTAPYGGFLGEEFTPPKMAALKVELDRQLGAVSQT